jgi:hypothetical protein
MAGTQAAGDGGSVRDQAKVKTGNRVLASPLVIPW